MSRPSPAANAGGVGAARADARRNRDQILDAAASLLARRPDASIGEIAEQAGLGRATVYRHFPDVAAIHHALREEARENGKNIVRDRLGADPRPGYCEGSLGDELLRMTRENLPQTSRFTEVLPGAEIQDEDLVATFTPGQGNSTRTGQNQGQFPGGGQLPDGFQPPSGGFPGGNGTGGRTGTNSNGNGGGN